MPNVKFITKVPVADAVAANLAYGTLIGEPESINFDKPYSADGNEPATHYVASPSLQTTQYAAWDGECGEHDDWEAHSYTGRPNVIALVESVFNLKPVVTP